jgi:hypothetical protein
MASMLRHALAGALAVSGRAAEIDARLSVQAGAVSDLDRRIAQIDKAVEAATQRGRTNSAMQLAADQKRTRGELVAERIREGKTLAALQVEKVALDGERRMIEADLGPVRYLATLLGAGDQDVLRWFILVVWRCCSIRRPCCCSWQRLSRLLRSGQRIKAVIASLQCFAGAWHGGRDLLGEQRISA